MTSGIETLPSAVAHLSENVVECGCPVLCGWITQFRQNDPFEHTRNPPGKCHLAFFRMATGAGEVPQRGGTLSEFPREGQVGIRNRPGSFQASGSRDRSIIERTATRRTTPNCRPWENCLFTPLPGVHGDSSSAHFVLVVLVSRREPGGVGAAVRTTAKCLRV